MPIFLQYGTTNYDLTCTKTPVKDIAIVPESECVDRKNTHAQCPVELLGLCGRVPAVETSPSVSQLINVLKPAVEKRSIIAVVIIAHHQYIHSRKLAYIFKPGRTSDFKMKQWNIRSPRWRLYFWYFLASLFPRSGRNNSHGKVRQYKPILVKTHGHTSVKRNLDLPGPMLRGPWQLPGVQVQQESSEGGLADTFLVITFDHMTMHPFLVVILEYLH